MNPLEFVILHLLYQAACQGPRHGIAGLPPGALAILDALPIGTPDGWRWGSYRGAY